MQGNIFIYGLVGALAIALLVAAFTDIRRRQIDNWLNAAIALGAPAYWWAQGLMLWPDVAMQVGVALLAFVVLAGLFALKVMGGGDVKLLSALALWIAPLDFMRMLLFMSLIGGDRVTLNYAAGFEGAFSVAYSARRASSVRIYDGLNGSGNVLATIQLGAQWDSECGGDPNGEFCNWTTAMASFSGVGKSVDFFGSPGDIYFDDVALGATAVPEPATWAMMITGFGLTGAAVRRRRFSLAA